MRVLLLVGLVLCGLLGCDGEGDTAESDASAPACNVTAPSACPSDPPTYADVEPIFQQRCVTCHSGDGMSQRCPMCWGLVEYSHIISWATEIRGAMLACEMPPSASGITMTDAERMKLLEWIRCGTPE